MKKIVLGVVLILVVMTGRAQSFEGSIKWKMNLEITDPKAKAQMEEAKKKANDPANQAKMKELQDKMNDPQFKAMLEQNPQMKAQMEAMLKMIVGGDMSSMLPTAITMKLKGSNSLTSIEGGILDKTDILYVNDKDATYTISHNAKTYTQSKSNPSNQEKPKVTKTSETTRILNHTCTKYIIEINTPDGPMKTDYWATNELKDIDLKALAKQQIKDQKFVFDEIDGFPLKVQAHLPQGIMTMEVTGIDRGSIPTSAFVLPSGYTETKM